MNGNPSKSDYSFFENFKVDNYFGVILDIPANANYVSSEIPDKIKENLIKWENNKYRSVTITIPAEVSDLIKEFVKGGFYLHHTLGQSVVICKWLDKNTRNKIPEYAHNYVGIGAIIVNKKFEVLLVKEASYQYGKKKPWKFVTGLVNEAESFQDATLREVKEEIGLTTVQFLGNFTVREIFPTKEGKSDICFFNLCTVDEDNQNSQISFHDKEICEKNYFKLDELINMEDKMTDMTWFNVQKLRKVLEEYQKDNSDSKENDTSSILNKLCRPLHHNIDKSKHFKNAVAF